MSVKRFDVEVSNDVDCLLIEIESGKGSFVYASDYDELRERVAWMLECATGYEANGWAFWLDDDASNELCDSYNAAWKAVEELL